METCGSSTLVEPQLWPQMWVVVLGVVPGLYMYWDSTMPSEFQAHFVAQVSLLLMIPWAQPLPAEYRCVPCLM